ncbi:hypothetical protein ABZ766_29095 [Streptomyces sp. NPDC006670]|uniref:hypothetical protein n=1 Tax=Streptomyces sp. NPDC006670 TaxID=3154476 RepID=UPI0033E77C71
MRARARIRGAADPVPRTPGSVRHSFAVLAGVALATEALLFLTDGAAAAATGLALITAAALALGLHAAGGGARDGGPRERVRLLDGRSPALGRWRRLVADTLADEDGTHLRTVMRPHLQRLFAARLAERHGVEMYRDAERAGALIGDALWPWIDPGATPPRPTLPEPVLRSLLDRLDSL